MYLIEFILKKWFEKKKQKAPVLFEYQEQEEENCENHIYLPIDSTCDYLACKNCGHIIKNKKEEASSKNRPFYDKFDNF